MGERTGSGRKENGVMKQLTGKLLIVILATLISLLLAEGISRLFIPQWMPRESERANFWLHDHELGWKHRKNQQGTMKHIDFSISVSINSRGDRDDEYLERNPEKKRIVVTGDSFAWGFGVEKNERFSEVIENKYNHLEVINTAVSGYSTDQEFLKLVSDIEALKPDLVILLLHKNDFGGNTSPNEYGYEKPFFQKNNQGNYILVNSPVVEASTWKKLERYLNGNTWFIGRAYSFVSHWTGFLTSPIYRAFFRTTNDNYKINVGGVQQTTYDTTTYILSAMNDLCKSKGAIFVILSTNLHEEQQAVMNEFTKTTGIPYLDLKPFFIESKTPLNFEHDFHWNAAGHQLAAGLTESFLQQHSLLPRQAQ